MICPICKKNRTTIISDKFDKFTNSVKRKRYCICGNFFSTFEKFEILRKPKQVRADSMWKNIRFIFYAQQRLQAAHKVTRKAYIKIFNLKTGSREKLEECNLHIKKIDYVTKKGKSHLIIEKKNDKKKYKFEIEGKKQTVRNAVKWPGYWTFRWAVFNEKVYDFKKPFDVRYKPIKKSKKIKSFSKQIKLEEDRLNNDKVRKEVDEYYKSVCTYIKDPQYNKAFFVKNDPFFKPFWEHPFWWEVYELVR